MNEQTIAEQVKYMVYHSKSMSCQMVDWILKNTKTVEELKEAMVALTEAKYKLGKEHGTKFGNSIKD